MSGIPAKEPRVRRNVERAPHGHSLGAVDPTAQSCAAPPARRRPADKVVRAQHHGRGPKPAVPGALKRPSDGVRRLRQRRAVPRGPTREKRVRAHPPPA